MKLLLDMNLPPRWVEELGAMGHEAVHWASVGPSDAPDSVILSYATENSAVLLTHDLDFGAILAASGTTAPSVLTLRADGIDASLLLMVAKALETFSAELHEGALIIVDAKRARARLLPLKPQ